MNNESEQAIGKISNAVNRVQGLYKRWANENGISYGTVQVLYVLVFKDNVTQKEISSSCEIPKQTVNNTVRELKRNNMINMQPSESDKRVQQIALNKAGRQYANNLLERFFDLNAAIYQALGDDQIDIITNKINIFGNEIEKQMDNLK